MDIIRFMKIPRRAPKSNLGNKEKLSRREPGIHLGKVGGVCMCVCVCVCVRARVKISIKTQRPKKRVWCV